VPLSDELCLGRDNFKVCVPPPTTPQTFGAGAANDGIDTDGTGTPCTMMMLPNGGTTVCAIIGTSITIGPKTLFISGSHPAVLFAADTITITGAVDVGSHFNGPPLGAGGNPDSCGTPGGGAANAGGGGGGAGGTFGQVGGDGGHGAGAGMSGPGTAAGPAQSTSDVLRGGCRGSDGGAGAASGGGGNNGGGAILLVAGTYVSIAGYVNASGGGGGPGGPTSGGGGGGSGGMIALDAPTIAVTGMGHLIANGGGGGGGGGASPAMPGGDPMAGMPDATRAQGRGGMGSAPAGGAGSSGGASTAAPVAAANAGAGAGGGGGGDGLIRVLSGQVLGGLDSPTPVD
jgi:hypothetical protein